MSTTPTSYSLDLAFSSQTQSIPSNAQQPIYSMGFGFSQLSGLPGSSWTEKGQAAEHVKRSCPFYFTVFDTAPGNAQKVNQIAVDFGTGDAGGTPFVDSNHNPVLNPIVQEGNQIASQRGQSAGCNVVGTYSLIGPYYVSDDISDGTEFQCTVEVTTQNNQVFSVDPEIIVEGDG